MEMIESPLPRLRWCILYDRVAPWREVAGGPLRVENPPLRERTRASPSWPGGPRRQEVHAHGCYTAGERAHRISGGAAPDADHQRAGAGGRAAALLAARSDGQPLRLDDQAPGDGGLPRRRVYDGADHRIA